jgi:hypothetical protein
VINKICSAKPIKSWITDYSINALARLRKYRQDDGGEDEAHVDLT